MLLQEILSKELNTNISNDFMDLWTEKTMLKRNEFLVKQGQLHPYLFWVKKGSLRIFFETPQEDLTIRFGYQYSFISALTSFLNNTPAKFYIQAIKQTELIGISRINFLKALELNPVLATFWQKRMEQLVIEQLEREIDLLTPTPQERYKRVLQRSPRLFQEIPLKYIASYLRMTPETLSRLRKS